MALVLMEGFDHLTAGQMTTKGWSNNPNSVVGGRFGGQAFRWSNNSSGNGTHALPASYSTLFMGCAVKMSSVAGAGDVFTIQAGSTLTCRLQITAAGILRVQNSGSTTVATGTTALNPGTWYYVEVKVVIAGASGSVEVHLNGVSEIAATTGNFASTNVDTIGLNGARSGASNTVDFDDIYVLDTTGSAPRNTFLGDVRVATIYPSSDGAHTAWTPDSGTAHFSRVNETTPDGDTSYVSDSTPGDIDSYGFGDIDGAATVYGVQTNLYARKDDAATRQIAPLTRQASTDYVGATVTLGSTYTTYSQLFNQDPVAADWTAGNVNADEFGVKEIA